MKIKAAVLYEQGKPRPYAESRPLVIETLDLAAPGPDEALIEIRAAGLCHSDLSAIEGVRQRALPMVIGHECAGIVREIGANVYLQGKLPVDRLRSGTLGFDGINAGFDRLADGDAVRQILDPHAV